MISMNLKEALSVYGTSHFEVLCYLLFPNSTIEAATAATSISFDGPHFQVEGLLGEDWPSQVVVVTATINEPTLIPLMVLQCIHRALTVRDCRISLCMFDGAFHSYRDLFSPELASQTYAFCVEPESGVLCTSTQVRASKGWRLILEEHRILIL